MSLAPPPPQVEQLGSRLGVSLASERVEDLKTMYGIFVESMIPTGEASLNGREADAIRDFKVALGLTDEEAAPVHLDVGRRLTRLGAEAGSREGSLLEKKVTTPADQFLDSAKQSDVQRHRLLPRAVHMKETMFEQVVRPSCPPTCFLPSADLSEAHFHLESGVRRPEVCIPAAVAPRVRPLGCTTLRGEA